MIDFTFSGSGTEGGQVWVQSTLEPLAPGALTPFTGSLLTEVVARAWFLYYDRLGFDPAPRSRLVRLHAGRPLVNQTISATLDAAQAGVAPPIFRLDGAERPLFAWERPGLFAGMKLGHGARRIEATLAALRQEVPEITAKAAAWYTRVAGLRWSQAEVLQIMEEIERVGAAAFLPYFAARHNLEEAYHRLQWLLGSRPATERVALIGEALGGSAPLELEMAQRVRTLGTQAAAQPDARAWLAAGSYADWETTLPPGDLAAGLRAFLADYGHRGLAEGEIAAPRLREAPAPLFAAVQALAQRSVAAAAAASANPAPLLAAIDGKARKGAEQLLERMRPLLDLQSRSLHAFAYILAGTRRWALAAGREAMADQRIPALESIFFYELEEVKQMMTGEWNVSDRDAIHAAAAARQAEFEQWQRATPVALIWGERAAQPVAAGAPVAAGVASGAAVKVSDIGPTSPWDAGVVLICEQPAGAMAALMPAAAAFIAAQGSPLDPVCGAARALGCPGVVMPGATIANLPPAARVTVDGNQGSVIRL